MDYSDFDFDSISGLGKSAATESGGFNPADAFSLYYDDTGSGRSLGFYDFVNRGQGISRVDKQGFSRRVFDMFPPTIGQTQARELNAPALRNALSQFGKSFNDVLLPENKRWIFPQNIVGDDSGNPTIKIPQFFESQGMTEIWKTFNPDTPLGEFVVRLFPDFSSLASDSEYKGKGRVPVYYPLYYTKPTDDVFLRHLEVMIRAIEKADQSGVQSVDETLAQHSNLTPGLSVAALHEQAQLLKETFKKTVEFTYRGNGNVTGQLNRLLKNINRAKERMREVKTVFRATSEYHGVERPAIKMKFVDGFPTDFDTFFEKYIREIETSLFTHDNSKVKLTEWEPNMTVIAYAMKNVYEIEKEKSKGKGVKPTTAALQLPETANSGLVYKGTRKDNKIIDLLAMTRLQSICARAGGSPDDFLRMKEKYKWCFATQLKPKEEVYDVSQRESGKISDLKTRNICAVNSFSQVLMQMMLRPFTLTLQNWTSLPNLKNRYLGKSNFAGPELADLLRKFELNKEKLTIDGKPRCVVYYYADNLYVFTVDEKGDTYLVSLDGEQHEAASSSESARHLMVLLERWMDTVPELKNRPMGWVAYKELYATTACDTIAVLGDQQFKYPLLVSGTAGTALINSITTRKSTFLYDEICNKMQLIPQLLKVKTNSATGLPEVEFDPIFLQVNSSIGIKWKTEAVTNLTTLFTPVQGAPIQEFRLDLLGFSALNGLGNVPVEVGGKEVLIQQVAPVLEQERLVSMLSWQKNVLEDFSLSAAGSYKTAAGKTPAQALGSIAKFSKYLTAYYLGASFNPILKAVLTTCMRESLIVLSDAFDQVGQILPETIRSVVSDVLGPEQPETIVNAISGVLSSFVAGGKLDELLQEGRLYSVFELDFPPETQEVMTGWTLLPERISSGKSKDIEEMEARLTNLRTGFVKDPKAKETTFLRPVQDPSKTGRKIDPDIFKQMTKAYKKAQNTLGVKFLDLLFSDRAINWRKSFQTAFGVVREYTDPEMDLLTKIVPVAAALLSNTLNIPKDTLYNTWFKKNVEKGDQVTAQDLQVLKSDIRSRAIGWHERRAAQPFNRLKNIPSKAAVKPPAEVKSNVKPIINAPTHSSRKVAAKPLPSVRSKTSKMLISQMEDDEDAYDDIGLGEEEDDWDVP